MKTVIAMEFSGDYIFNFINNKVSNGGYIVLFIFMLYFLIHNMENVNIDKKVGILNIIVFLLCFFNILDTSFVLLIYLISIFIYFFILNPLTFKDTYLKHPLMFILDYLYKLFIDYGFLYLFISLILSADFLRKYFPNSSCYLWITLIIGGYFVCRSVIECIDDKTFAAKSLDDILKEICKMSDYHKFKYNGHFMFLSSMLITKEDRSFFARSHSYNWFCTEFIWYRIRRFFSYGKTFPIYYKKYIGKIAYVLITLFHALQCFLKMIWKLIKTIIDFICYLYKSIFIRKKKPLVLRHLFSRGYSTIEMQVIRTIALSEPQKKHYIKRKVYELVYSYIFFNCLKDYYNCTDNLKFKYYIINIYLNIAPVRINKFYYDNIYKLYKKPLKEITKEEFYIYCYGLSFNPISEYILYDNMVNDCDLDKTKLLSLINKF